MPRTNPLAIASGVVFVTCLLVAVGYGLWTQYGSGERIASVDLSRAPEVSSTEAGGTPPERFGPLRLDPGMNPARAVLHATFAPVGSTRTRYELALVGPGGRRLWEKRGSIGSSDDDASVVTTTGALATFDVAGPGEHFVEARFTRTGMDHLRKATLELRRNVLRVDTRITWGFGIGAAAGLAVMLVASRGAYPYRTRP